jgi:hypothetical protein
VRRQPAHRARSRYSGASRARRYRVKCCGVSSSRGGLMMRERVRHGSRHGRRSQSFLPGPSRWQRPLVSVCQGEQASTARQRHRMS